MTRESPTEESTISTSLSNTIRKSLSRHASTVKLYDESRPALKRQIASLKKERYWDQNSIDSRKEVLRIYSYAILGFELLSAIADRIDTNPFPAERLSLRDIAFRLMPDVSQGVWFAIFDIYELSPFERHYFPVCEEMVDIEEIEERLQELLGKREELPVSETKTVMPWVSTSKTYKSVKRVLQERGWLWRCVKREGKVTKVIIPPKVTDS